MKLHERLKAIAELEQVEVPWEVARSGVKPSLFGSVVFLAPGDGDSLTLDEARAVVEWLAEQFGGSVKWQRAKK